MNRPRHTKHDANQADIVFSARALGMLWLDTSDNGGEMLDGFFCWRGRCVPTEIKAKGKRDKLTVGERMVIAKLAAVGVKACIAECLDDVLHAFGAEGE